MWLAHYVPGMERKCSHSQKSNDRILPGFLIVLTRQENYSFQAKSGSVFGMVWLPIRIFLLLKISIPLKNIKETAARFFDLTLRAHSFQVLAQLLACRNLFCGCWEEWQGETLFWCPLLVNLKKIWAVDYRNPGFHSRSGTFRPCGKEGKQVKAKHLLQA